MAALQGVGELLESNGAKLRRKEGLIQLPLRKKTKREPSPDDIFFDSRSYSSSISF
jgi:hypothetical protein